MILDGFNELNAPSDYIYRQILENATDIIAILNENFENIYLNEKPLKRLTGYNTKELLGKRVLEVVHPKDQKVAKKSLKNVLLMGKEIREIRVIKKDGSVIWLEIKGKMLTDENNQKQIVLICRDISNYKEKSLATQKSEEKYKELRNDLTEIQFWKLFQPKKCLAAVKGSQEMLKLVMDNIPQYIAWKNKDLEYLGCNTNFALLFGLEDPNLIIGKTDEDLNWKYNRPESIQEKEEAVINNNKPKVHSLEPWQKEDGDVILIDTNRVPLYDIDENVVGLLMTYEDITERKIAEEIFNKELEKKVEERTRELLETEKELRAENIALQRISQFKNDFITMAAHELKTPLISISGYIEFIQIKYQETLNTEINEDLAIVERNIKRLKNYMNQLLDVMRVEEDKLKLNKTSINLTNIINQCIRELKYLIQDKKHNLIQEYPEEIVLEVDEERIFQVFSNLLSNAIKFTNNNGEIRIYAERFNNSYVFRIRDNGIGLNEQELKRIFNKFEFFKHSENEEYNKDKGTGLGLFISKGIIEAHGGTIEARSEGKNKGTEFIFTLPY